jgi:hypothetical protein
MLVCWENMCFTLFMHCLDYYQKQWMRARILWLNYKRF